MGKISQRCCVLAVSSWFILVSMLSAAQDITLGIHSNYNNSYLKIGFNNEAYKTHLAVKDCPPLDAKQLAGIQRISMDILLICNAVKDAGLAERLVFRAYPNVARGLQQVLVGRYDMVAQTLFTEDHAAEIDRLLVSSAVIRRGEFEVGVFTTRNRSAVLATQNPADFKKLTGKIGRASCRERVCMFV